MFSGAFVCLSVYDSAHHTKMSVFVCVRVCVCVCV